MKKMKIGLTGMNGKMGQEIVSLLKSDSFFSLTESPELASLWIDFSSPKGLHEAIKICLKNQIPLVSGTTGFSKNEFTALKKASKKIPVFWASNMSFGISLVQLMIESLAAYEGQIDYQIIEKHHRHKKDRPSGTALTLQKKLEDVTQKKAPPILSVRGGGIFGEHELFIMSDEEVIEIKHQALSRKVFARGALKAGRWLLMQKPGLYNMESMLRK